MTTESFTPSDYAGDEDLRCHINSLSLKADSASLKRLTLIADYVLAEIVDCGATAGHLPVVNAILCSGIPCADYPDIVNAFEQAIISLANTREKTDIDLAPYFYSLWGLTQKPDYLDRFENTLRRCYLTLAANRHYPNLGINKEDSVSLSSALRFLDEYRLNVWIINDRYDVDKVMAKYASFACKS
ncbi:MAG: hypothetical protein NC095_12115 [Muribaculum sp.]|nr:hypothetical protein [Muribaculum sp.]